MESFLPEFIAKMRGAQVSAAAVRAFEHAYHTLLRGGTGMIPETEIEAVAALRRQEDICRELAPDSSLLAQVCMIKLNGGLGTSMGLERAKSLLEVKPGLTFLDFIARQLIHAQRELARPIPFRLLNSYNTSADTLRFLGRYPELGDPARLELMQNQVPKVDAGSLRPAVWKPNPQLEWCPPGHGDLYPSLLGSGMLERLLAEGVRYVFVSNADNLGATLDEGLLTYFARSGAPFLMEVAERTASDRKGGHLARRGGGLILREAAQCPEADQGSFQDIERHRFFNTNNIWMRLDALKALLDQHRGVVPLPVIRNCKTVDPRDRSSAPVIQLETAMGAAIECFPGSEAVVVARSRFAPVKTTADLLALRSDAYRVNPDWTLSVDTETGSPPIIDLDAGHYKLVDQLERSLSAGAPSLRGCLKLRVTGPVMFSPETVLRGTVEVVNATPQTQRTPAGIYEDTCLSV